MIEWGIGRPLIQFGDKFIKNASNLTTVWIFKALYLVPPRVIQEQLRHPAIGVAGAVYEPDGVANDGLEG